MDENEDPRELERKIETASRIASSINDQTTIEQLRGWVEELRQKLRQLLDARRSKQEISVRARDLWEQNGCPAGRDLEFWLQAESEMKARERQV
jgi:Protein of unknown function (DUF2934)